MKTSRFAAAMFVLAFACSASAEALTEADKQKEDLAQFRRDFFDKDKSYPPAARREAEKKLTDLGLDLGMDVDSILKA